MKLQHKYRLDRQVLCSKIAPSQNSYPGLQNSPPGLQNSPPELQKRPFVIETKGAILEFRGAILQTRGAILPGGYFAAQNLKVLTVYQDSICICIFLECKTPLVPYL